MEDRKSKPERRPVSVEKRDDGLVFTFNDGSRKFISDFPPLQGNPVLQRPDVVEYEDDEYKQE